MELRQLRGFRAVVRSLSGRGRPILTEAGRLPAATAPPVPDAVDAGGNRAPHVLEE